MTDKQTTDHDREQRTGALVLEKARSLGWADDGEGAIEFLMRRAYEQGMEDYSGR